MDPLIIAAAISANSALLVAWIGRRTNGRSPMAAKLDDISDRLAIVEIRQARLEGGMSRNARARADIVEAAFLEENS